MAEVIVELKDLKKRNESEKVSHTQGGTVLQKDAVNESEGSSENTHDDLAYKKKQRKEKWVNKMIESGIDRVKLLKPSMLKGQPTNSLEKAMEYSFRLKERAQYSSVDEAELKVIGTSMEEYAFYLIEPLKNDIIKRAIFKGKEFDHIAEKAVLLKQKKFLAHPVMYDLLRKRWARRFYSWQFITLFDLDCFKWWFLSLWTPFDCFFFPVIFFVLFVIRKFGGLREKRGIDKKDAFEIYHDYFTTPYFIFQRDTLSYLVLLALHFAMSIRPSTLHFAVVEWIILLFFLGRFMMEVYQAVNGLKNEKEKMKEGIAKRQRIRNKLSKMLYKYLSDQWNVLDATTLIVYVIILILRVITWSAYTSVSNNRLLAVAGYFYGLNCMLLTLRVFGHIMEFKKTTGTIQIALFQIIGAVLAVFGQFFAVLVAFSLAISKIRMTELSYAGTQSTVSFKSWWNIARHLFWSLLIEPELLQSSDETSSVLIQILYGLFLIMAVVMLMNMMIALLTNTYQQVEDNAFYEWSYKKAATINTYCNYHSVPVPFNIISLTFLLARYLCKKICCHECSTADIDNDPEKERHRGSAMDKKTPFSQMIIELESIYYSVYGDEFPITGDRLDHVMKHTEDNRQLIGHIAERLFNYGSGTTEGVVSDRRQKWDVKGIGILENRLSYDSCECHQCSRDYKQYHGAKYLEPLSPEMPGFEILIVEASKTNHDLILGVVDDDFDLHKIPGMEGNTVGYQVGKEIICDATTQRGNCLPKIDHLPEMADRGDLLGCELLYGRESNDDLYILFTLNGRKIGEGTIENGNSNAKRLYAFVSIGSQEISVRFKQRYLKHVSHDKVDHTSILMKQLLDQLTVLNKNYSDLKQEVQSIRSEMRKDPESEKKVIAPF
uniref:Transient receptor potential-gamma protein-like n=1 Tax=Actinia tenebrosa TaxID=6105 RepID=A0A6P8IXW9_ACTTE